MLEGSGGKVGQTWAYAQAPHLTSCVASSLTLTPSGLGFLRTNSSWGSMRSKGTNLSV